MMPWHGRRGAAIAWAALSVILLAAPCYADPAQDLLDSAQRSFAAAQYALAARGFQRAIADYPGSASAETAGYLLGVSFFYAGQWDNAIAALETFRASHPRTRLLSRSSYWLGAANLKLGKFRAALDYLDGSGDSTQSPGAFDASAVLLAGMALEGLGRDAEAAERYRTLIGDAQAAAFAPEARYRLAGTEFRAGRFGPARDLYGRVILESPESPWVRDSLFFLAECELALDEPVEAQKRYRTLLSVYPSSPWQEAATFRIAYAVCLAGDYASAVPLVDLYLHQYPSGAYVGRAYRVRAEAAYGDGRLEQAVGDYAKAATLADGAVDKQGLLYSRGLAELKLGRDEDAARSFGAAARIARGPVGEEAIFKQAILLAGIGADADAVEALGSSRRDYPDGVHGEDTLRLLASLLEKSGDHEGAVAFWNEVITRYPRSASLAEALFRRAGSLAGLGRSAEAMDDYQRIAADFPSSAWKNQSLYSMGSQYALRGEYARALPFFRSVAEARGADGAAGDIAERARLSVGICLFDMGSYAASVTALDGLLAAGVTVVSAGDVALYTGRGLYRLERLDEAAARFAEAERLFAGQDSEAQKSADAGWWLAWSLLRLGRIVDARDAFLSVARDHPSGARSTEALYRAGVSETMRYDDLAAVKLFDEVLAAGPGVSSAVVREQALYEKGWALSRLQRPGERDAAFSELATDFPDGSMAPAALFKLAEAALDRQSYSEARAGFQRVSRDFPRSTLAVPAMYWSAEATRRGGDPQAALEGYWACLSSGVGSGMLAAALDGFRAAMRAAGSEEIARRFAERASRAAGLSPDARSGLLLGCAGQLLSSNAAEALTLISRVRDSFPGEPWAGEASLLTGRYYVVTGDLARALRVFTVLEGSRSDEVGARAAREHGLALEAAGRTSEAVDELAGIGGRFPGFDDIAAQGLFDARRIALARGDRVRAAALEQALRTAYPLSPWAAPRPDSPGRPDLSSQPP